VIPTKPSDDECSKRIKIVLFLAFKAHRFQGSVRKPCPRNCWKIIIIN